MSFLIDYFNTQKYYQEKYGDNVVVLLQKGSFYEMYEYNISYCESEECKVDKNGKIWEDNIGHAIDVSKVIDSVLTVTDSKTPYGIRNPHMIGFPVIAYERYRDRLLSNNYIIARIDQRKVGSKIERFEAEIAHPTFDSNDTSKINNTVIAIYIEYQKGDINFDKFLITTGVAVIDITTGKNRICEFHSKNDDQSYALQELYRFLISHYPREIKIYLSDIPTIHVEKYKNYITNSLELYRYDEHKIYVNQVDNTYKKISYQVEFLNKVLNTSKLDDVTVVNRNEHIIEHLDLQQMTYGRIAYILLLQYCYSYNSDIISKIQLPDHQWIDSNKHLILTHNAIVQLDLITTNNKKKTIDSLFSILDQTDTKLGKRLLHNLIQNPMCKKSDIEPYYEMINELTINLHEGQPLWLSISKMLKVLPDLERLYRKLRVQAIKPSELSQLFNGYVKIINIYILLLQYQLPVLHSKLLSPEKTEQFNGYIQHYSNLIDFKSLSNCKCHSNSDNTSKYMDFEEYPFYPGTYPELDTQVNTMRDNFDYLRNVVNHLNSFNNKRTTSSAIINTEKKKQGAIKHENINTVITATNAKANNIINSSYDRNFCGTLELVKHNSTEKCITSDIITNACESYDNTKHQLRYAIYKIYNNILIEMDTIYNFYDDIHSIISIIDVVCCYSKLAYRNNYYRPEVDDGVKSYVKIEDLRHPIIEKIIDGRYITNNVSLGLDNDGMILFGVNQTGKSSLGKAVLLTIIMAQIGCYTPGKVKYCPYHKIITRSSGQDDLFKGQSSFAIEMSELRTILKQSDMNTLVMADELSRGTESKSATGITVSSILSLLNARSSFIITTHMHHIVDIPEVKQAPKLSINHLTVTYDDKKDVLIYDRKLKEGPGSSNYGLMVAKSLGLPNDFIIKAQEIIKSTEQHNLLLVNTKSSKYNKDVYMTECAFCSKTTGELHTHHILEQHLADIKGMIGHMHKNVKNNLITLCKDCHVKLHQEHQTLESLDTCNGLIINKM